MNRRGYGGGRDGQGIGSQMADGTFKQQSHIGMPHVVVALIGLVGEVQAPTGAEPILHDGGEFP